MAETVLVTGGTGFVVGWCIADLLEKGYAVRTTVRDLAKEPAIRAAVGDDERLTVVEADLISDTGWDDAVAGCDYVLHVASPMVGADMATPARDGTLRVLAAAVKGGVKRVVMTSSCAAATPPPGSEGVYDEKLWTDVENQKFDPYRQSKVLSERAAWKFVAESGGSTTLTTVLPGAIFGPIRTPDGKGSVEVIGRMLGGMPGTPRIGLNIVDVRDVADLHIRAMTAPEAAGERFIAVSEFMWMSEVATEIRAKLGDAGRRVPSRTLPNLLLRAAAVVTPELRALVPMLGRKYTYTSSKAQTVLGWKPRPAATTVVDCAKSLTAGPARVDVIGAD